MTEKFVFQVHARNKHTGMEKIFKYTCVADCYTAALIKCMNVVKVDPRLDFESAELKEKEAI